jgi:anti-anti-sigma factor
MHVHVDEPGQALTLSGQLDASTVPDVRLALHAAVDKGHGDLVVDIADVELLDATGLGVLVGAHRRAGRHGRRLVLRSVPPRVDRLLFISRLYLVLHVDRSRPVSVA